MLIATTLTVAFCRGTSDAGIVRELRHFQRIDGVHDVELAAEQAGGLHRVLGHELEGHAVERGLAPDEVVVEAAQLQRAVARPADQLKRTGPDRVAPELVAGRDRVRRQDCAPPLPERGQERRERLTQHEPHGQGVDHLHPVDRGKVSALRRGGLGIKNPVERRGDVPGVEHLAVVEPDVRLEPERPLDPVGRHRPRGGEIRHKHPMGVRLDRLANFQVA